MKKSCLSTILVLFACHLMAQNLKKIQNEYVCYWEKDKFQLLLKSEEGNNYQFDLKGRVFNGYMLGNQLIMVRSDGKGYIFERK